MSLEKETTSKREIRRLTKVPLNNAWSWAVEKQLTWIVRCFAMGKSHPGSSLAPTTLKEALALWFLSPSLSISKNKNK